MYSGRYSDNNAIDIVRYVSGTLFFVNRPYISNKKYIQWYYSYVNGPKILKAYNSI